MHIPSRRNTGHTTGHATLRSRGNRHLRRQGWIQIQRIERILLSRSAKRVIMSLLARILSSRLGTLERRRIILLTRILSIPVITRYDFSELRWDIGKVTFWSGVFGGGELEGPACQFEGCMVCEVMDCSAEFELEAFKCCFVGCVSQVSVGVEGFFNAEGVVLH